MYENYDGSSYKQMINGPFESILASFVSVYCHCHYPINPILLLRLILRQPHSSLLFLPLSISNLVHSNNLEHNENQLVFLSQDSSSPIIRSSSLFVSIYIDVSQVVPHKSLSVKMESFCVF